MAVMKVDFSRLIASALWALVFLSHGSAPLAQTPEQKQMWDAQRAAAQVDAKVKAEQLAMQRAARKSDPMAWVGTLNPLTAGGWQFRAVAPDGSWASFSTERQLKRSLLNYFEQQLGGAIETVISRKSIKTISGGEN